MYKYYSLERPVSIGTYPNDKNNKMIAFENFENDNQCIKKTVTNEFIIKYLSVQESNKYKIKNINAISDEENLINITNGMLALIEGQLLYNEKKDMFIVNVSRIIPLKQRSGLAEETILIKFGNELNYIVLDSINYNNLYLQTYPKPIPGNINFNGLIRTDSLKRLCIQILTRK